MGAKLEFRVPLVLIVDEAALREGYKDCVADHEWYATNDPENGYPDEGYGRNVPPPFEKYAEGWVGGICEEVCESSFGYRIERVDPSASLAAAGTKETKPGTGGG